MHMHHRQLHLCERLEEVLVSGIEALEGGEEGDCGCGQVHYEVGDCWGDG